MMRALFYCAMAAMLGASAQASSAVLTKDVVFSDYSPLSAAPELARRLFTPLAYRGMQAHFADVREQSIDLAHETFVVRVPDGEPPATGYGLLVFIPPWPEASVPKEWPRVLDRFHLLFVSAANSGNEARTLDRRIPLALLGYENVRKRYAIDPNRVYIGGMSGGSRVALRVALAYPDVFHGALPNAGSDPIGGDLPLPPADLFRTLQESTRFAYLTGGRDEYNLHSDVVSRASLQKWCVLGAHTESMPQLAHEVANAAGLAQALDDLDKPPGLDAGKLSECRARIDREIGAKIAEARGAIDRGDRARVEELVRAIDAQYGGLAADAIDALQASPK